MDEIRNIERADVNNLKNYKQLRKNIRKALPGWKIDLKNLIVIYLSTRPATTTEY